MYGVLGEYSLLLIWPHCDSPAATSLTIAQLAGFFIALLLCDWLKACSSVVHIRLLCPWGGNCYTIPRVPFSREVSRIYSWLNSWHALFLLFCIIDNPESRYYQVGSCLSQLRSAGKNLGSSRLKAGVGGYPYQADVGNGFVPGFPPALTWSVGVAGCVSGVLIIVFDQSVCMFQQIVNSFINMWQ